MPHTEALQKLRETKEDFTTRLKNSRLQIENTLSTGTQNLSGLDRMAQSLRQQMHAGTTGYPEILKFVGGQIDSESTGDTVLLTGVDNKCLVVSGITAYHAGANDATFRFELDYGSSFGSTARISTTDASAKETQGQEYLLTSTERIVINVTSAGSSTSLIDYTVNYKEVGYGAT